MSAPLLLFDVDGTLLHVAEELVLVRALIEHCGGPVDLAFSADMVVSDDGYIRGVLRRAGLPHADADVDAALQRFVGHLRAAIDGGELGVRAVAGAADFVAAVRPLAPIALGTGCVEASARAKLAAIGLDDAFPCGGFSRREASRAEILQRGIAAAAAHYRRSFAPAEVIYLGDGPWDVAAAREVGARFVGINEHADGRERLRAAGAQEVFGDLTERGLMSLLG